MEKKILTLCIIQKDENVLLGMKKRGFGVGKWNGFGGKVLGSETIEQAAVRECEEETGISPLKLQKMGELIFTWEKDALRHDVHIFRALAFSGSPRETEEMKPQWFRITDIPYQAMWADDRYWLPLLLKGEAFKGGFHFRENSTILRYTLHKAFYDGMAH